MEFDRKSTLVEEGIIGDSGTQKAHGIHYRLWSIRNERDGHHSDDVAFSADKIPEIIDAMGQPHSHVRATAAWVMSFFAGWPGSVSAVEPLEKLLRDADPRVREQAALTLRFVCDVRDGEYGRTHAAVKEACRDPDNNVRKTAVRTLQELEYCRRNFEAQTRAGINRGHFDMLVHTPVHLLFQGRGTTTRQP